MTAVRLLSAILMLCLPAGIGQAQTEPVRAPQLGIPLDGTPGPLDAITDVPGVAVGHATLISGSGKLRVGSGPVRTGVTAIFPRGTGDLSEVFAGWFSLNGNGEMTGTPWIDDYGLLLYPITITNTNSVGTVRDAVIEWGRTRVPGVFNCCLPAVAETWDGDLNDIYGFHVTKEHVFAGRRIHGRRAGAVQLRPSPTAADSGCAGGAGDSRARAVLRHRHPARSLPSSPPMRHFFPINCAGWPAGPRSGSAAWVE